MTTPYTIPDEPESKLGVAAMDSGYAPDGEPKSSTILPGILVGLTLLLALVTGALIFRNNVNVFTTPLTEDGFYSLAVARNIARGLGMTADGIHPTNGFQPLFTMIEAVCYRLSMHGSVAIRLVTAISWVVYLATGLMLGRIAAGVGAPQHAVARRWIATVLYLGGFLSFMHHFNALETGSLMLLYATLWLLYQRGWLERRYGPAMFGVLLGLLVLTRIDASIFVAVFVAWHFLSEVRDKPLGAFIRAATMGGLALVVSAPWWIYSYTTFGSFMPTSGTAQQAFDFSLQRWRWIGWAFGVDSMPTLWLGRFDEEFHDGILPSLLRAVVALGLIVWLGRLWTRRAPSEKSAISARTWRFAALLGAALVLLSLYYGLTFIAYWFYYRYLFPAALISTVAIAWGAAGWVEAVQEQRRDWIVAAIACLLISPTVISAIMAQNGQTLHVQTVYWEQLALIDQDVPRDDYVAAGQAGTLGYFRPHVVNVDGKVNREVVNHQERMWDYLREHDVRWFADWPYYVEKYLGQDPESHGWHKVGERGYWQLWHYDGETIKGSWTELGDPKRYD
jgi:hypothetical protein